MYKKYTTNSIKSIFFKILIKLSNYKKNTSTKENSIKYMKICEKKIYNPKIFKGMTKRKYQNCDYYTYNEEIGNATLFYIHGGSFVDKPLKIQIDFAKKVANKINAELIVPLYKTLPNGNCNTFLDDMTKLYSYIKSNNKKIFLMGDSAGGGAALSLNMYLINEEKCNVDMVIMLSPWLDLSLDNNEVLSKDKNDIVCSVKGNKFLGEKWAENIDIKNYKASPIYGNFNGIKKVFISCGGNEICQPDCIKISNKLKQENINYKFIEFNKQFHNFELYPTKESNILINEIFEYVMEEK